MADFTGELTTFSSNLWAIIMQAQQQNGTDQIRFQFLLKKALHLYIKMYYYI